MRNQKLISDQFKASSVTGHKTCFFKINEADINTR